MKFECEECEELVDEKIAIFLEENKNRWSSYYHPLCYKIMKKRYD